MIQHGNDGPLVEQTEEFTERDVEQLIDTRSVEDLLNTLIEKMAVLIEAVEQITAR